MISFLYNGGALLRLEGGRLRLRTGIILPYVTLKLTTFVVRSDRDVMAIYFGSSLLQCNNSVTMKTVAVLADIVRFTVLPLRKVTRKTRPVSDCGCNTGGTSEMGGAFHLLLVAYLSCSMLL